MFQTLLTEIIISYGAKQQETNGELKEIGSMILMESIGFNEIEDLLIREYMIAGGWLKKFCAISRTLTRSLDTLHVLRESLLPPISTIKHKPSFSMWLYRVN
jgi:hypothetical protein